MNVLVPGYLQRLFSGLPNLVSLFHQEVVRTGQMDLILNEFLLSTRRRAECFTCTISCWRRCFYVHPYFTNEEMEIQSGDLPRVTLLGGCKAMIWPRLLVSNAFSPLCVWRKGPALGKTVTKSSLSSVSSGSQRTLGTQCHSVTHPCKPPLWLLQGSPSRWELCPSQLLGCANLFQSTCLHVNGALPECNL